jgi:hypothetical protein
MTGEARHPEDGTASGALQQNLGRDRRVAALTDELDGPVEVGLAVCEPLREVDRVPGLDQHVQAPACDSFALGLVVFSELCHRGSEVVA